ncbi:MAG: hypothetical protein HY783_00145 [Chloroflexi bacterium]|nr:hypothetical protein [Chloroflexota bacterium]
MSVDGILNVHKPRGLTSHDVVEAVRIWSQQKRVGHAGTLDPLATGVLILCLGRATRLASYLEEGTKSYRAEVFLEVRIHRIELVAWEPPTAVLAVECGKGTYIRSLARDLGQLMGCGAHLSSLVRLSSGRFFLEDAVDMENLQLGFAHGFWEEFLYPVDEAVLGYDAMILGQANANRLKNGQPLSFSKGPGDHAERSWPCRAYSLQGQFLALMSWDQVRGHWLPSKVFV